MSEKIGVIIKQRRKELELTLDKLATKANISKSFLWKVEQGNVDIGFSKIRRVFDALDMDMELIKLSSRPLKSCDCHVVTFIKGRLKL